MTVPASISARALASLRFGDLAGDGRSGASIGGEVESGMVAVTIGTAAGITGIVAATIAASPVLVIAVVRTSALVAASRDARQAWGRDPLAASAMAPKAGASPLAAKRVSAAFMGVAFMEADSVAAASMEAEVADGAKPRGSPHAGQFPIVFGQMLAPQGS